MVSRFLRDWEDSELLPSEAARDLIPKIFSFDRFEDAVREFVTGCYHCEEIIGDAD